MKITTLYTGWHNMSSLVISREPDFIVYNRTPDTESAITKYALWILQLFHVVRRVLSY